MSFQFTIRIVLFRAELANKPYSKMHSFLMHFKSVETMGSVITFFTIKFRALMFTANMNFQMMTTYCFERT